MYYHSDASASASREFLVGGQLVAGIDVQSDFLFLTPTWAIPHSVLGAQLEASLSWAVGSVRVRVDGVLSGCTGTQCTAVVSGSQSGSQAGGSDLYPMAALKWVTGKNNNMAYLLLQGVPTGAYQVERLANLGLQPLGGGRRLRLRLPRRGRRP